MLAAAAHSSDLSAAAPGWLARRVAEQRALWRHLARRWYVYAPFALIYLWALEHIGINWTPSLPYTVVFIERCERVQRGDLVVFRFEGGEIAHHLKGQRFFKRVAGLAGDEIAIQAREVFVNGVHVGSARSHTLDGRKLDPIRPGRIPAGHYYVQGAHAMSFDSRYRINGLVRQDQILGIAKVIL